MAMSRMESSIGRRGISRYRRSGTSRVRSSTACATPSTDPVAKARGLVRSDWLEAMLADPNTARTNLGSNALWQVALLEMWLQERGI